MVTKLQLSVRPATLADRARLANLIHFEVHVHRHLDWRPPLEWVGSQPYLMGEAGRRLVATLACPADPPGVAWIRLFAVVSDLDTSDAWHSLWPEALAQLQEDESIEWAAAIPLQQWFQALVEESGFTLTHRVVMLSWEPGRPLVPPAASQFVLRPMNYDDLPAVQELDEASFVPVWQNSLPCLEMAFRQAALATVADLDGRLIGYQISTAMAIGGHLARLAVYPSFQHHGVGYAMVRDLLLQFERRGAHSVTVNTQQDNRASLALYQKAGFHLTGEEYPIYQLRIHER